MSKLTLYLIILSSAFTIEPGLVKEGVIVFSAVLIGTGAAIAFNSRSRKINIGSIVASLFMGLFVGILAREVVIIFDIPKYKILLIVIGSGLAEYIMTWFNKRYMGLFDSISKKVGIQSKENKES